MRQTTFFVLLNSTGKPLSSEIPEPFGPRKRVQVSAGVGSAARHGRQNNANSHLGISVLSHCPPADADGYVGNQRYVGRICISGIATRGGNLATDRTASATSTGCIAFASTSAVGLTGRFSSSSDSTKSRANDTGSDAVLLLFDAYRVRQPDHAALGRLIRRSGDIGRRGRRSRRQR